MGEIADMMIEGDLCECCGVYLDSPGEGYARRCASCSEPEKPQKKPKKEREKDAR